MASQTELAGAIRSAGELVLLAGQALARETGIPPRPETREWAVYGPRMRQIHMTAPGPGHLAARRLQDLGLLRAIVTEGDDVLFDEAGVRDVLALAGSVELSICPACTYNEPLGCLLELLPLPRCAACGGVLEPDVAVAGEPARVAALTSAAAAVAAARLVVVAGAPGDLLAELVATAPGTVLFLGDDGAGTALAAAAEDLAR